jgi:hypothetical protein
MIWYVVGPGRAVPVQSAGLTVESAMRDGAGVPGEDVPVCAPSVPGVTAADVRRLVAALAGGSAEHEGAPSGYAREAAAPGPVAAVAVRALCLGELDIDVHKSICLCGLRVTGRLDLSDARLELPVSFIECEFDDVIDLTDARPACVIRLERCRLMSLVADRMRTADDLVIQHGQMKGTLSLIQMQSAGSLRCSGTLIDPGGDGVAIDGRGLRVAGSVLLDRGFHARGEVGLTSAHIDGDLDLNHALCSNPGKGKRSIDASWLVVGGELLCQPCFRAEGEVFLQWAQLKALRASGAAFINDGGNAINADGARVATGVFLDNCMQAKGQISLVEAKLDGELNLSRSTLEAPGEVALKATRFETREIYLNEGFKAEGEVSLGGAKVSGQLNCTGGRFHNKGGSALHLGGLTCDGDVFLNKGFHADGQVRLTRATIQRELNCSGGTFTDLGPFAGGDRPPRALDAESLVAGSVYLNHGFHADGEVFLIRSNIAQQLDCAAGTIENPGRTALDLSGAHVNGDIRLNFGFRAVGEVRLSNAFVGQHLDCEKGEFEAERSKTALNASGLQVAGSFIWLPEKPPAGFMDLSFASVGRLEDAPDKWPTNHPFELRGFVYTSLKSADESREKKALLARLAWLAGATTYSMQVYQQLATVYRQQGLEKQARRVALEKYRQRRKLKLLPWWSRGWNWFQEVTVGYGYRLYNALFIVIALGVIGTILFSYAQHHNFMLATGANPAGSVNADQCTQKYPCFTPYVYSFQLLLPVVNLHQTDFWLPNLLTGFGVVLLVYTCFAIVLGWMLGIALVAGLGRVFSRD